MDGCKSVPKEYKSKCETVWRCNVSVMSCVAENVDANWKKSGGSREGVRNERSG